MELIDLYNNPNYPEFEEIITAIDYTRKVQAGDTTSPLVGRQFWLALPRQEVKRDWPTPVPSDRDWRKLVLLAAPLVGFSEPSRMINSHP
jgi:hypothetical protein